MSTTDQPNDDQFIERMEYIGDLFFRKLRGGLDEQEQRTLDSWLSEQNPASRKFFEEMQDLEEIRKALRFLYEVDRPAALADVQKKIKGRPEAALRQADLVRPLWNPWLRRAAVAAVVLLFAGGVYWLTREHKPDLASLSPEQRFKSDPAPGGEHATLQLDNGQTIVLDSAANGEVASQGATRIVKQADGRLAYSARAAAPAGRIGYNRISTPRGGQYNVILPDGSKVWLNALSVIRFPTRFTGRQRRVELSGEAYFEVEKNAEMPFIVAVSSGSGGSAMEVDVLGTRFNIEAYSDEKAIRATLVDGLVKVKAGSDSTLLTPSRQGSKATDGSGRLLVSTADTSQVLAWKNGLFQFKDAPLETIMRQVSRWYDVDIIYEGKINQSFSGKIPRTVPASTLLKILESTGTVHFMTKEKKVMVLP